MLKIQEIRAGDIFWERFLKFRALTNGKTNVDGAFKSHSVKGEVIEGGRKGEVVDFLVTEGYEAYGPKLSKFNMYA